MKPTSPAAEQRRLQVLVGRWEAVEEWTPSHLHPPESRRSVGRLTFRSVLDGFALVQDYAHVDGAVTYRTHGVLRWNAGRACYVLTLFDSMGHPPQVYSGGFLEEDVLVFESEAPVGGRLRTVYTLQDDGFTLRMEMDMDGEWLPLMRARYRPVDESPGGGSGS